MSNQMTTCCESPATCDTPRQENGITTLFRPRADIFDGGDAWHITVELPGVDQSGVDVTVEQGILTVRAESALQAPEGLQLRHAEYTGRKFARSFRITDDIDTQQIAAEMKHGLLRLKLPKALKAQPQKVAVKAAS